MLSLLKQLSIGLCAYFSMGIAFGSIDSNKPESHQKELQAILESDSFNEVDPVDEVHLLLQRILPNQIAHSPIHQKLVADAINAEASQLNNPAILNQLEKLALERQLATTPKHDSPLDVPDRLEFDIPIYSHPLVDTYIEYFTGRGRSFFAKWIARANRYAPIMVPILEKEGLPKDTLFLAMIESGFSASALSSAKAAGFWQFIPSTGRIFKLKQNFWVDERRDFISATKAACKYLKQLHKQFKGDWHLAWAGYNAGGSRISRALKRYKETNYWSLIDNHPKSLAKETKHYVPKLIAAATVAKNAETYGFDNIKELDKLEWDPIYVNGALDIRRVAKKLKVKVGLLRQLNPSLLHYITPPKTKNQLRVPKGKGKFIQAWVNKLPKAKRFDYIPHKIKRGETLYSIAGTYGTKMATIRDFNKIQRPRALKPGRTLLIPSSTIHQKPKQRVAKLSKRKNKSSRGKIKNNHRVSPGDTLWSIARQYKVTIRQLKKWNNMKGNQIRAGDVIRIF